MLLLAPLAASAQMYKCVDAAGKVHYTDTPGPGCRQSAIKPSPARWAQYETQTKANALVKEFCAKDDRLAYMDVVPLLLGKEGQPRVELYQKDRLHLSPAGYEILAEAVRKAVN